MPADNTVGSSSSDDRIVNHNNTFSLHSLADGIQLYLNTALSALLLWFDKGSSHVRIFYKSRTIGYSGLQGISQRSTVAGLRYTHHKVCLHRGIHGKEFTCHDTGAIDTDSVNDPVRT